MFLMLCGSYVELLVVMKIKLKVMLFVEVKVIVRLYAISKKSEKLRFNSQLIVKVEIVRSNNECFKKVVRFIC